MESFNYISFGNWEVVNGEVHEISMSRGRMFEYTPSDIEKRLESLDTAAISFLESLPTFLCSEIQSSGSSVSMIIKFGRISEIKSGRKEVSMTFGEQINFGEVTFDNVEAARSIFGLDRFQLSRTHWAVREGDAKAILALLASHNPDHASTIDEKETVSEGVQPPLRDKKILGIASSVEDFLQLLYP